MRLSSRCQGQVPVNAPALFDVEWPLHGQGEVKHAPGKNRDQLLGGSRAPAETKRSRRSTRRPWRGCRPGGMAADAAGTRGGLNERPKQCSNGPLAGRCCFPFCFYPFRVGCIRFCRSGGNPVRAQVGVRCIDQRGIGHRPGIRILTPGPTFCFSGNACGSSRLNFRP